MNRTLKIPVNEIRNAARADLRPKLLVCLFVPFFLFISQLSMKKKPTVEFFRSFTRIQSFLLIDLFIAIFLVIILLLVYIQRISFFKTYTIQISDIGIKKYNVKNSGTNSSPNGLKSFEWTDIQKVNEGVQSLIITYQDSRLRKTLKIPTQLEQFEELKDEINSRIGQN